MSISSSTRKAGPFACNGSTVAFPFAFKVFTTADVRVVLTDSNSVESDLALGTNYTVALNADQDANPGGTVTTTATYATGYKITLTSQVQNLQPVTLTNQGGFYPQVINNALDRLTIMAQQLAEQVSRAVKTSISSSSTPDQLLSDIGAAVTNASNSATAAAGSATNSANSATASANSATAAANSATQAANSAAAVGFDLASVSTFQNKTLQASGGNTVEATRGPGASALSMRNRIINGNCQVAQRGAVAVVNGSLTYGGCDRIGVAPISFTTCSGTIQQQQAGFGEKGFSQAVTGVTTTGAGVIQFVERLEAKDVKDLNGKQITVQAKFYHNTGAALNCGFVVSKAGALDNFASPTVIATGATSSVPSGSLTTITTTFTMGATDCGNGLQIMAVFNGVGAVTAKDFHITELQLEAGPVATPFEHRPYQVELAMCQRYYELNASGGALWSGTTQAGAVYYKETKFSVQKRAVPSITFSDVANSGFPAGVPSGGAIATDLFWGSKSASASVGAGYFQFSWTASAEL